MNLFQIAAHGVLELEIILPMYLQVSRCTGISTSKQSNICVAVWILEPTAPTFSNYEAKLPMARYLWDTWGGVAFQTHECWNAVRRQAVVVVPEVFKLPFYPPPPLNVYHGVSSSQSKELPSACPLMSIPWFARWPFLRTSSSLSSTQCLAPVCMAGMLVCQIGDWCWICSVFQKVQNV